ncbi:adenylyl-sulfate kinase [Tepidibacter aestuarii]|uniref:adenylyl-sulfate kinase n=1 Tax=Tepidibacter aestuarii TaxID=2925782 RepID=UPI002112B1B4|nr:adenylyl-sulfate kinase [Tepidibacter aestuarii]CAH2214606.1 putative adenylylsulfate kinase [Tepidibacter aestuarii]
MNKAEKNIVWHSMNITRDDREKSLKQTGLLLWFTGLSGSGKSTIGSAVEQRLYDLGKATYLLDGDNVRHGLNKDLSFSEEDRKENIRRIGEVANLFVDSGLIIIGSFISPYIEGRDQIRKLLGNRFIEIYVDCSLETCEQRDPKGLYSKARNGEIKQFTGIDSEYEVPVNPEIVVKSDEMTVEECVDRIIKYIDGKVF